MDENPAVVTANKVLRFAVDLAVKSAETAVKVALPDLALPVVSSIVDFVIGKFGDYFYTFLAEHATILVINFETKQEKDNFMGAINELQTAVDPAAHQAALQKAKDALAKLGHWDGITTPSK